MGELQKRAGAALWMTVVVVALLVLYPLSLGPVCWVAGDWSPDNTMMETVIPRFYYPVLWLARSMRHEVAPGRIERSQLDRLIVWYSAKGRRDSAGPYLRSDVDKIYWTLPRFRMPNDY